MFPHVIDPELVHGWLAARSIARGLPMPVLDRGGFYVNTNSETELQRWVFPNMCERLIELGKELKEPRTLLKLCAGGEELRAAMPQRWQTARTGFFMKLATFFCETKKLPGGYQLDCVTNGDAVHVQIHARDGELAASGYGAAYADVFAYDRIRTASPHRRKGLGWMVVTTLQACCPSHIKHHLLVATDEGYQLYMPMGGEVLSPYSTAEIPAFELKCAGQF